jgi:hypothetical protein
MNKLVDKFDKFKLEQNIDNEITEQFNNLNINNDQNMDDSIDKLSNPLYGKFISIEVANCYCKNNFDDEDFIHQTFELPNDLIDDIQDNGNTTITDYFEGEYNNIEFLEDDNIEQLYYNLYGNCIIVYDKILEYYNPSWYKEIKISNDNNIFDKNWTDICKKLLSDIKQVLNYGMKDESLEYLCEYNKEVYCGLFIIMKRLGDIFTYFNDREALCDFIDDQKDYRLITIRLINNICVILLYLKFYYLYNNNNIEKEPYSDKMINIMDDDI